MPQKIIPIGEGAEELFIKTERFNTTLISFNFYLPINKEKQANYALLPFVLTSCGKNYPDFSRLNFSLAKLYGANLFSSAEKVGDFTLLKMGISVINDRFALDKEKISEEAVKMLLDLIFNPKAENGAFCSDDLEREKRKAIEHIKSEMGEKRIYAKNRLIEEMFSDDVYGIPKCGTVEQVKNITGESLFEAWKEMLQSAFLRINIVSAEEPVELLETVKETLLKIKRENITDFTKTMPARRRNSVKDICEKMDIAQGKLCMGFNTGESGGDKETAALTVACDIFGGGPYSKLFTVVREKMSLCYYCSAAPVKVKGFIMVSSGIESENAEKARKEIINQLSAVGKGEFSDDDLRASVRSIKDSLKTFLDSQSTIDNWYSIKVADRVPYTPDEVSGFIDSVTRDDVTRIARNITLNTVYTLLPKEAKK